MKYNNLIIMITFVCSIILTGCSTTQTRQLSALDVSGQPFETKIINPTLEPVVKVGNRIKGHAQGKTVLGFIFFGDSAKITEFKWGDSVFSTVLDPAKRVRDYALFEACQKETVDFIVCPRYVIKTKNYIFVQKYDVTVSGFAGKYVSFRHVPWGYKTEKDLEISKNTQRINKKYDFGKINEEDFGSPKPVNVSITLDNE